MASILSNAIGWPVDVLFSLNASDLLLGIGGKTFLIPVSMFCTAFSSDSSDTILPLLSSIGILSVAPRIGCWSCCKIRGEVADVGSRDCILSKIDT